MGDLKTPESGCCCRVIQVLLQSAMHEPVLVMDFGKSVQQLDQYADLVRGAVFSLLTSCFWRLLGIIITCWSSLKSRALHP